MVLFLNWATYADTLSSLASTPGVNLPESVTLDAYSKPRAKRSKSAIDNAGIPSSELLLQSSAHPKLDFTGKEGENELDNYWNHYVAVYDPKAGTLRVAEARKMNVRACIRYFSAESEEESDEEMTVAVGFITVLTAKGLVLVLMSI